MVTLYGRLRGIKLRPYQRTLLGLFLGLAVMGSIPVLWFFYIGWYPQPYTKMRGRWTAEHLPDALPSRRVASSIWKPKAIGVLPYPDPFFELHLEFHDPAAFTAEVARLRALGPSSVLYGDIEGGDWDDIEHFVRFSSYPSLEVPSDTSEVLVFEPASPPSDQWFRRLEFSLIDTQERTIDYAISTK